MIRVKVYLHYCHQTIALQRTTRLFFLHSIVFNIFVYPYRMSLWHWFPKDSNVWALILYARLCFIYSINFVTVCEALLNLFHIYNLDHVIFELTCFVYICLMLHRLSVGIFLEVELSHFHVFTGRIADEMFEYSTYNLFFLDISRQVRYQTEIRIICIICRFPPNHWYTKIHWTSFAIHPTTKFYGTGVASNVRCPSFILIVLLSKWCYFPLLFFRNVTLPHT